MSNMGTVYPRPDAGAASHASIAAMADTLASETRLLHELAAILRRQRDAVAGDDLVQVEESVYSTHRVLLTLGEARRRRRSLDEILGASAETALPEAYASLREAALALSREVEVSRDILQGALARSDEQIRSFYEGGSARLFYDAAAGSAPVGGPAEGTLLNRRA